MRKRSSPWLKLLGAALVGYGCGWAWRLAGEREADPAAVLAEPKVVAMTGTISSSTMESGPEGRDSVEPTAAPKASVQVCEMELRRALATNDKELINEKAHALARLNGVLALHILLDSQQGQAEANLPMVLRTAAAQNPQGVLKLFLEESRLRDVGHLEFWLFAGAADKNVEAALALFEAREGPWSNMGLQGIAQAWGDRDWRTAANYGAGMVDATQRQFFINAVLGSRLHNNFGEVAAWLRTLAPATLTSFGLEWRTAQPKSLEELGMLLSLAPASYLASSAEELEWAMVKVMDGSSSTESWLHALPSGEGRDLAWQIYAIKAAGRPEKLAEALAEMQDPAMRSRTTSIMAGLMAFENPQAALTFAGSLGEVQARAAARRTVVGVLASNAPGLALEILLAEEEFWPPEHMGMFSYYLGVYAPAATASAALRVRNPQTRSTWLNAATGGWWKQDRAGVVAWVNSLPQGPDHDQAVVALVYASSTTAPAQAMNWAAGLANPISRSNAIVQAAGAWQRTDPAGFQAWLAQAELDAQTRGRVTAEIENAKVYRGGYTQSMNSNGLTIYSP